jgi:hypothetical protein
MASTRVISVRHWQIVLRTCECGPVSPRQPHDHRCRTPCLPRRSGHDPRTTVAPPMYAAPAAMLLAKMPCRHGPAWRPSARRAVREIPVRCLRQDVTASRWRSSEHRASSCCTRESQTETRKFLGKSAIRRSAASGAQRSVLQPNKLSLRYCEFLRYGSPVWTTFATGSSIRPLEYGCGCTLGSHSGDAYRTSPKDFRRTINSTSYTSNVLLDVTPEITVFVGVFQPTLHSFYRVPVFAWRAASDAATTLRRYFTKTRRGRSPRPDLLPDPGSGRST